MSDNTSPSPSSSPTTATDDDATSLLVSNVERLFLNGDYVTSLTLGNRYLHQTTKNIIHSSNNTNEEEVEKEKAQMPVIQRRQPVVVVVVPVIPVVLNVPLCFKFDDADDVTCCPVRYVSIQLSTTVSPSSSKIYRDKDDYDDNEDIDDDDETYQVNTSRDMQQIGAITLQSWYELSKQQQQRRREQQQQSYDENDDDGYRFLQPFLNTFTSLLIPSPQKVSSSVSFIEEKLGDCVENRSTTGSTTSMSLELFVIFIRFLASTFVGHEEEAILLLMELFRHVRSSNKSSSSSSSSSVVLDTMTPIERSCCQELLIYFLTELIPQHCGSVTYVNKLLDCVKNDSHGIMEPKKIYDTIMTDEPKTVKKEALHSTKDVLQLCLQFCNTDDEHWPIWIMNDAFVQCRLILQKKLRNFYYTNLQQQHLCRAHCNTITGSSIDDETKLTDDTEEEANTTLMKQPLLLLFRSTLAASLVDTYNKTFRWIVCEKVNVFLMKRHNIFSRQENVDVSRLLSSQHRPEKNDRNHNSSSSSSSSSINDVMTMVMVYTTTTVVITTLYRYRHRISKMVYAAILMSIWKPIQEIYHAIRSQ